MTDAEAELCRRVAKLEERFKGKRYEDDSHLIPRRLLIALRDEIEEREKPQRELFDL